MPFTESTGTDEQQSQLPRVLPMNRLPRLSGGYENGRPRSNRAICRDLGRPLLGTATGRHNPDPDCCHGVHPHRSLRIGAAEVLLSAALPVPHPLFDAHPRSVLHLSWIVQILHIPCHEIEPKREEDKGTLKRVNFSTMRVEYTKRNPLWGKE